VFVQFTAKKFDNGNVIGNIDFQFFCNSYFSILFNF